MAISISYTRYQILILTFDIGNCLTLAYQYIFALLMMIIADYSNPGSGASPWSKNGEERREQRRCQERSDCHRNDGEGWVCQGH